MLIVEKLYKPSDFPIDGTTNLRLIYIAIFNLTNMIPNDVTAFGEIQEPIVGIPYQLYTDWVELMYLFDTYIGNQCLFEYPKI
jgi:hypothetical protein